MASLHHALKPEAGQQLLPYKTTDQIEPLKVTYEVMNISNDVQINIFLVAVAQNSIWNDCFCTEPTVSV